MLSWFPLLPDAAPICRVLVLQATVVLHGSKKIGEISCTVLYGLHFPHLLKLNFPPSSESHQAQQQGYSYEYCTRALYLPSKDYLAFTKGPGQTRALLDGQPQRPTG